MSFSGVILSDDLPLSRIMSLHEAIFGELFPVENYKRKLAKGRKLLHTGFYIDGNLVGYCLTIDIPEEKRLHGWVGGILPEFQGRGLFGIYHNKTIELARSKNYESVTGNTDNYKPNMLCALIKRGFDIIGVSETSHGDGVKIHLRYRIAAPIKVRLCVTGACNFNCFFCHHEGVSSGATARLSPSQIEKILIQAKKANVHEITITGGEPALNWDAVSFILQYCRAWGHPPVIKIVTNGSLWSDEALDRFADYSKVGSLSLNVSLHTIDAQNAVKICGHECKSEYYREFFAQLASRSLKYRANTVVLHGLNDRPEDFAQISQFLMDCAVPKMNFLELLVTRTQPELFAYYCPQSRMEQNFLAGVSSLGKCEEVSRMTKKSCYKLQCGSKILETDFYRLTCRDGCQNCLENGDITIGADYQCYPCYLEPNTVCGDARKSFDTAVAARREFIAARPNDFCSKTLYWGECVEELF